MSAFAATTARGQDDDGGKPVPAVKVSKANAYRGAQHDLDVAARFAPVFVQGLGEEPRLDYITRFDFDGDWQGDNNWKNADNEAYALTGAVYYSVSETPTHYYIHYAVFHPRDYKGGEKKGALLSKFIRSGLAAAEKYEKYDPTGRLDDAVLAHENDLEGCLVVVEKKGASIDDARVVYVETLAHNKFLKYAPEGAGGASPVILKNGHPRLFVEPKGHGVAAVDGTDDQKKEAVNGTLIYRYMGKGDNPAKVEGGPVGYELVPIYTTLWQRAKGGSGSTYGEAYDFSTIKISTQSKKTTTRTEKIGKVGVAFSGKVGALNMARAPWGWFDPSEKNQPLGHWFFDPAATIQRHFKRGQDFSTTYVHNPILDVFRAGN